MSTRESTPIEVPLNIGIKLYLLVINIEANSSLALEKGLFTKNAEYFQEIFAIRPVLREKQ